MIFKTFDNNIDKWTAKIGIFGKSFDAIVATVNNTLNSSSHNIDNFDESTGFWKRLKNNLSSIDTGKNWIKNSLGEIISKENIDSYIKELDLSSAQKKLQRIFDWQKNIENSNITWQEFFNTLHDSEDYIVNLIKSTEDLSRLEGQDLVNACHKARESVILHNQELENMSLKSKAGKVALQALSAAANTALMFLASMAVQALTDVWNSWNKTVKSSQEQVANISSRLENLNQELSKLKSIENKSEYDHKSAAVDSLESERDARIEVLEAQKEQYEEQIKLIDEQIEAKEKIIDGISEEIDAIKDANEQRKREIDLEKSKYELERMMNQHTILQYSADKGMHYTQDTKGARDAKQAVEDAELEIEIAGISGNDEPEGYFFKQILL